MTYLQLFDGVEYQGALPEGKVSLVTQDSRRVEENTVFVCIKGRTSDGHNYGIKALEAGATVVVTDHSLGLDNEVVVADTRKVFALLCQNFFGCPAKKLTLIGVTGTNGKTTVSSLLCQLLQKQGVECGLIGTIHSTIGKLTIPAKFTTPEPWDLAALMARMVSAGCTHVVMEASSQALEQGRLSGVQFALGIFTNLTRDHLDYHGTMEEYFAAKKSLFYQCDAMLTNIDDPYGKMLLEEGICKVNKGYSTKENSADFMARSVDLKAGAVRFGLLGDGFLHPVRFPMPGEYSVYNALAAAGGAMMLGFDGGQAAAALREIQPVRGRCEVLYDGPFSVICDFAHTADGIEKLLSALRPFAKEKMVVLFGCAGQRDAAKRAPMSEAVLRYADAIFLTSDNPRMEDMQEIFKDALPPLKEGKIPFTIEADREKAVHMALDLLGEGDLLVLCGKGHEEYQVLNGYTVYLNERQIVEDWLKKTDQNLRPQERR